jgi:hypothetical protein
VGWGLGYWKDQELARAKEGHKLLAMKSLTAVSIGPLHLDIISGRIESPLGRGKY